MFSAPVLKSKEPESSNKSDTGGGPDIDDLFSSFLSQVDDVADPIADTQNKKDDPAKFVSELKSKNWEARSNALEALAKMGAAAAPHVADMAACLADRDNAVRNAARKALETVKAAAEAEAEAEEQARRAASRRRREAETAAAAAANNDDSDDQSGSPAGKTSSAAVDRKARIQALRRQQRRKEQDDSSEESGTDESAAKRPRTVAEQPAAPAPAPEAQDSAAANDAPKPGSGKEAWEYMKSDSWGSGQFFSFNSF